MFVSAAAVVVLLARRKEPTPWIDLIWLGGAFSLALPAVRGIIWWALSAPVVVAGLLPRSEGSRKERGSPFLNLTVVACTIGLVASLVIRSPGIDPSTGTSMRIWQVSQHQVDAVRDSLTPGSRLFVAQASASWFEFALPSMSVFVDSRIEIFPERVWADYYSIVRAREGWQRLLDRWNVDAVVTDRHTRDLRERMEREPGWQQIYADHIGAVFVRTDS